MSEYFNEGQRQLQENFETVPLADVLPPKDAHLASNEQDVLAAINRN